MMRSIKTPDFKCPYAIKRRNSFTQGTGIDTKHNTYERASAKRPRTPPAAWLRSAAQGCNRLVEAFDFKRSAHRNLHIRKSRHGAGAFCKDWIYLGQPVLSFRGDKYQTKETLNFQEHSHADHCIMHIGPDLHVLPRVGQFANFVNHSCDPNLKIGADNHTLFAIRDIAPGEQVTFHYGTAENHATGADYTFACDCGASRCTGVVSSRSWADATFVADFGHLFPPHMQAVVAARRLERSK